MYGTAGEFHTPHLGGSMVGIGKKLELKASF